jgi:AraC-like DNA-binding protein
VLSHRHSDFCHVFDVSAIKTDIDRIFSTFVYEFDNDLPFSKQRQTNLLSELLVIIYRNSPSLFTQEKDKCVYTVWQIQCRFEKNCNEQYSLNSLAEEYHLNAYYLSHLFKKVTGYPIMQYLTKCRLSLARKLLTETDMSITDIVYNAGFSDSSNFSRLFKREMRLTPLQYRRSTKK